MLVDGVENQNIGYVKSCLDVVKNFETRPFLAEATLSVIANCLLPIEHQTILRKIFMIMDASGDGSLQDDEVKKGFSAILEEDLSDELAIRVVENVGICDSEGEYFVDYKRFLFASVDYNAKIFKKYSQQKSYFGKYAEKAYELFFDGSPQDITRAKLNDILCLEKNLSNDMIKVFLDAVVFPDNNTKITFEYLTDQMQRILGVE